MKTSRDGTITIFGLRSHEGRAGTHKRAISESCSSRSGNAKQRRVRRRSYLRRLLPGVGVEFYAGDFEWEPQPAEPVKETP
jgi:hypothetical protein